MVDFLFFLALIFGVTYTISYISISFMVRFFMNK